MIINYLDQEVIVKKMEKVKKEKEVEIDIIEVIEIIKTIAIKIKTGIIKIKRDHVVRKIKKEMKDDDVQGQEKIKKENIEKKKKIVIKIKLLWIKLLKKLVSFFYIII
jgi:hypothetical protein